MGLGLVIGDVSLQVLVSCSVEALDDSLRVELEWSWWLMIFGLCWGWLVIGYF